MVIQPAGRVLLILVLAVYAAGLQAAISVSPDRPQVMLNESFQLVFEADGPVDGDPDFTPLEDKFQIISTGQSSNFSMLNGQVSRTQQWTLTLLPKEAGTIEVPPINFGVFCTVKWVSPGLTRSGANARKTSSPMTSTMRSQRTPSCPETW